MPYINMLRLEVSGFSLSQPQHKADIPVSARKSKISGMSEMLDISVQDFPLSAHNHVKKMLA